MRFRYSTVDEYYEAIVSIMGENQEEKYDELVEEVIAFYEVSGSGK